MSLLFRQWTARAAERAALGVIERGYVREVSGHTSGLAWTDRKRIVGDLIEHLGERPPAVSHRDLSNALGTSLTYTSRAVANGGIDSGGGLVRWRNSPPWLQALQTAIPALILVGGIALARYFTAESNLSNGCTGARATEFERLDAAGATEYRMRFRQDERYGVVVCVSATDPGLTVERVYFPPLINLAVQPVGWELDLSGNIGSGVGDASSHGPWRPANEFGSVILWFEAEYCNAGRIAFDEVMVDYRYRGRSRSMPLPLGAQYSFDMAGQCTGEVRAKTDAERAAWAAIANPFFFPRRNAVPEMPLGLSPESVSRDLCRYLEGVIPISDRSGAPVADEFEPLAARAVFAVSDTRIARGLIDGAVNGICPDFADRFNELVELLDE